MHYRSEFLSDLNWGSNLNCHRPGLWKLKIDNSEMRLDAAVISIDQHQLCDSSVGHGFESNSSSSTSH